MGDEDELLLQPRRLVERQTGHAVGADEVAHRAFESIRMNTAVAGLGLDLEDPGRGVCSPEFKFDRHATRGLLFVRLLRIDRRAKQQFAARQAALGRTRRDDGGLRVGGSAQHGQQRCRDVHAQPATLAAHPRSTLRTTAATLSAVNPKYLNSAGAGALSP